MQLLVDLCDGKASLDDLPRLYQAAAETRNPDVAASWQQMADERVARRTGERPADEPRPGPAKRD